MRILKTFLGAVAGIALSLIGTARGQFPPLSAVISGPPVVNVSVGNIQQVMFDGSTSSGAPTIYRWTCQGDCRPSFTNSIQATNVPMVNVNLTSYNDITTPTSAGLSLVVCSAPTTCSTNPSNVNLNIFPKMGFPNGTRDS